MDYAYLLVWYQRTLEEEELSSWPYWQASWRVSSPFLIAVVWHLRLVKEISEASIGSYLRFPPLRLGFTSLSHSATANHIIPLKMSADTTVKGLEPSSEHFDGSKLRVAIVHARWNRVIIDALVAGTVRKLKERGVLEQNIVVETVPGSFELPFAVSRLVSQLFPSYSSFA